MKNLIQLQHPLLLHKLGFLRDKNTSAAEFRHIINELSRYLAYEATKDFPIVDVQIETPIAPATVQRIPDPPVIISIMRAGNGMLEGLLQAISFAKAGHIGIYRDKFINNTVEYYFKIPDNSKGKMILLADPLLATGDTIIASIDRLRQYEVGEIRCLCILASTQGLSALYEAHPDVKVYAIGLETELNDKGYLVPGLGDAGDRLFNTK